MPGALSSWRGPVARWATSPKRRHGHYIGRADALAHEACGSWRELAMSYILGRSLWGGKRAYNSVMKTTADVLLSNPKSPWVRYPW